ncbi:MAG: methylmalonyl-CoA epimerase, partial [Proteobacteria bacterium]
WVPLPVEQTHVELLKPTEDGTVIAKYLEKNQRDGIHHLSFRVENIAVVSQRLIAAGFMLTYPEPRPGAHHCLVNFIHPKTTGGVLVEITERVKTEGLIS